MSKESRISDVKKLLENNLIFFDGGKSNDSKRYIVCFDNGSGKDHSSIHLVTYDKVIAKFLYN